MGSHSLLQGILSTQGSKPGPPHCRQVLYHLSHQGSPCVQYLPLIKHSINVSNHSLPYQSITTAYELFLNTWLIHPFPPSLPHGVSTCYHHLSPARLHISPHPFLFLRSIPHAAVRVTFLIHKSDYITCLFPFSVFPLLLR